jgi:competence protein ComEC
LIQVHSIAGLSETESPEFVRLTHTSRLEVAPGRFVRCWSVLRPPPGPAMPGEYDFRRQAWFEQLGAVGYVQGRCRGGALGAPSSLGGKASLWLGAVRRNLALHVNEAAGKRAGGFAAALVAGDRSFMRHEDAEALRDTGLAHLLAISGLHLSIVGGLVFLLVKRALVFVEPLALRVPVQKPAAIIALVVCLAYLIISGSSVATQRAFIMAAIIFGAVIFDRSAISVRTFSIAMIAVVLLQPESVVTPGFQMSFAATGALIAAYEIWRDRRSGQERVLGPIAYSWVSIVVTSIVAGLATMPFALFHFDRAAPIGFVANLAAMPIVTFVSAPSAALAFILAPIGQSDIGLRLFGFSLELVLAVAGYFSQFADEAGKSDRSMPPGSLAMAALALASFVALTGRTRVVATLVLATASLVVWAGAPRFVAHWSPSGDLFISKPGGGVARIAVVKGDGLSPMRFSEATVAQCEGARCTLLTAPGIKVQMTLDQTPIVTVGSDQMRWTWDQIATGGGRSAYLYGDQFREVLSPECGHRPWHPCPVDVGAQTPTLNAQ